MHTEYVSSPIGTLRITSDSEAIVGIERVNTTRASNGDMLTKRCAREIASYFKGQSDAFTVPISAKGTVFQKKVWKAMRRIPSGRTQTYKEIASAIGKPNAIRAVGSACGKNPLLVVVPCHRVVASHGLGGFSAGIHCKKMLLSLEGVNLDTIA